MFHRRSQSQFKTPSHSKRHALSLVLTLVFCVAGCGQEATSSRAIRTATDVLDVRLSEANPDDSFRTEASATVGIQSDGRENRLLLFFPKIRELWDEKTITSSITQVEVVMIASGVPVNPENIELYLVTTVWAPQATWNSPFPLIPGLSWSSPGGSFDDTVLAATPAIRAVSDDASLNEKELAFDVTETVRDFIESSRPNYGFILRIRESENNATNEMSFLTFNSGTEGYRPRAILAFTTTDAFN